VEVSDQGKAAFDTRKNHNPAQGSIGAAERQARGMAALKKYADRPALMSARWRAEGGASARKKLGQRRIRKKSAPLPNGARRAMPTTFTQSPAPQSDAKENV